jgi:phosphatidylserine/phosphatidylglycerophosphate/cardiolipin synthase-like enzyme/uncharacterized membrane protein YdjX (TVP38/TMEM64 family)
MPLAAEKTRPILAPGRNVWRIERAARAAVLIDGANFFAAVRQAFLNARRSILIVGWDIHSRAPLAGATPPADGLPVPLKAFLTALVDRRPELDVRLLLWDYPAFYATEREWFPSLVLDGDTPSQITMRLDDCLPFGASQHQKIVLVDNHLAFSGGFDMTVRRWDRPGHHLDDPGRVDPDGQPYAPFHDVQMMVEGAAARALGELAATRWRRATGHPLSLPAGDAEVWPAHVKPDFTDVDVGIARTEPRCNGQAEVREVEALFYDSLAAAERAIYVENQFVTAAEVAEHLAARLTRTPRLEALIVTPQSYHSWIESRTMRIGRARFRRLLADAGVAERARLVYPQVRCGDKCGDTMVHSKVTIIDDRLLRVGSANLNHRSMGTDTECDLVIEAHTPKQRAAILSIRNRLIADHCGVDEAAAAVATRNSLIAAAETLHGGGHRLREIDDAGALQGDIAAPIEKLSDPPRPITMENIIEETVGDAGVRLLPALARVGALAAVVIALILAWRFTPLSEIADPDLVRERLAAFDDVSGGLVVVGAFVVAGLLGFPVTVLIAATAAAFGPWLGAAYGAAGALFSAAAGYGVGTMLGRRTVAALLGKSLQKARRRILQQGVLAVAAVRMVPIAPFTVVNIACGVFGVQFLHFIAGTALGLAPGIVALAALGDQLYALVAEPTPARIATVAALFVAWLGLCAGLQRLLTRDGTP